MTLRASEEEEEEMEACAVWEAGRGKTLTVEVEGAKPCYLLEVA